LHRSPCPDDRRRVEYRLTTKGLDFLPTMIALRQWGERWETGVPSNPVLCDERDRRPILQVSIRSHDDRVLNHTDLCWIEASEVATSVTEQSSEERAKVRKLGSG
jgi:DNA-binding MarR family transcriptional regulator